MDRAPRVKGQSIRSLLGSLRRRYDAATVRQVVSRIEVPQARQDIELSAVLPSSWYPLAWYRAIHAAIHDTVGGGADLSRELSRDAVKDDFRGIYRLLTMVLTPQSLLKKSARVFSQYFDAGKLTVTEAQDGLAVAELTGCTGFDDVMWEDTIGGMIGAIEACGGTNVRVSVLAGGGSEPHLKVELRWD